MVQIKKDFIQSRILSSARSIFFREGYMKASLRDIAQKSEITLSNLYSYYEDKDALFKAVLNPLLEDLLWLCAYGKTRLPKETPFENLKERKEYFQRGVAYIDEHRKELNLLFNLSAGSKLADFSDHLAKEYEETWEIYFKALRKKFPKSKIRKPSSFFLRSMAHFHLATLRQVLCENIARDEMEKISDELVCFLWHGGMGLMTGS